MGEKVILEFTESEFKKLVIGWTLLAEQAKINESCLCVNCCSISRVIADKVIELQLKNERSVYINE